MKLDCYEEKYFLLCIHSFLQHKVISNLLDNDLIKKTTFISTKRNFESRIFISFNVHL